MFEKREELVALADEFDDIAVDADGKCYWCDVANAQTHLRAQLHRFAAQASAAPPEREAKLREPALTRTQFVIQMILCYARIYPEITTTGAMARAAETFRAFLNDEKIEFGDARYAWDSSGAANIVYGYEGVDLPKALSSRDDGEAKSMTNADYTTNDPMGVEKDFPSEAPSTIPADVLAPSRIENIRRYGQMLREGTLSPSELAGVEGGIMIAELLVEIDRLKPFHDELLKIADDVGEPNDPFAAWEKIAAAISRIPVPGKTAGEPDWRDDPSADERWSAGLDYAMVRFCHILGVDPKDVTWDAATEELDGDVCAVIYNILRVKFGDGFDPTAPAPAAEQGVVSVEELAQQICDVDIRMSLIVAMPIARALLDKYSIRSALMTGGK